MPKTHQHPEPIPFRVSARPIPRLRVTLDASEGNRTKQAPKRECDINFIIDRYQRTGMVEHVNRYQATYGDAPSADFREALELVKSASKMFADLPSKVRARFEHDPAQFLAFCEDPANREEAELLGLTSTTETLVVPVPATPPPDKAE